MDTEKYCKNCGVKLDPLRTDKVFCSGRCGAQFARDGGTYREHFHAEKQDINRRYCEQCYQPFSFNDYAQRGGKREPKYCSGKCRQAAYRARTGRANHGNGYDWSEARDDKKGQGSRAKSEQRDTSQPKQDKDTSQGNKDTLLKRWKSKDPYEVLGVLRTLSLKEIKRAWLKLITQYHPDRSKDPNATLIAQMVNGAWATIEKQRRHEL